jgi:hypothetical protein
MRRASDDVQEDSNRKAFKRARNWLQDQDYTREYDGKFGSSMKRTDTTNSDMSDTLSAPHQTDRHGHPPKGVSSCPVGAG